METRTMAILGVSLWLGAASSLCLAADGDKAGAKGAPTSSRAKGAKDGKDVKPAIDANGVKPAGPRLQMADHPGSNPGKDRDLRHCLDLPTPKEVIRCSEQK